MKNADDLARAAGCSPSASSAHLARLVEGGLLCADTEGRQRLFRLPDPAWSGVVEAMLAVAPRRWLTSLASERRSTQLRHAPSCYDHLASELAVTIFDRLRGTGVLADAGDGRLTVTATGTAWCREIGIPIDDLAARRSAAAYAPAKAEVIAFTRHIAGEYAHRGVRANCVAPSAIENERMRTWMTDEQRAELGRSFPLGRLGRPRRRRCRRALPRLRSIVVDHRGLDIAGGKVML